MKDIKTFLIGFLTCSCIFLIFGMNSKGENEIGKYQIQTFRTGDGINQMLQHTMLDTETGEIYINNIAFVKSFELTDSTYIKWYKFGEFK